MSDSSRRQQAMWKLLSTGSGVAGAIATRKLLQAVWPVGDDGTGPPFNPADRRVAWPTALQWALAAGLGASVTRLLSERLAAAGWEAATGTPPPGIRA
jgi:hypothetical protein